MAQRVRISDIAQELGLSTATVSNVIHGKTAKISEQTVRRVQQALEQRQYIPSMAGILLAQNASRIIGIFVNDHEKYEGHTLDDVFIASSLNHLSTEIEAHGYFMMVKKAVCAEDILQFSSMWNMDGVVMIGFCQQDYAYLRSHMHIPFVVYDGFCASTERIVNITIDNYDGGQQVAGHFLALGHRRAVCVADNDAGVDRQRMQGFRDRFGAAQTQTLLLPMNREKRHDFFCSALPVFRSVTAVFAASDYYAAELMQFLQQAGLRIPEDLSVAGFDDIPLSTLVCPRLTTVHQDGAQRARLAVEQLLLLRDGQAVRSERTLPVRLIVRESTGYAKNTVNSGCDSSRAML